MMIVLHKMSVCDCACGLSGFGILHYYEGFVVSCDLSEAAYDYQKLLSACVFM